MNPSDARAIDRLVRQLERRSKRRAGGFSLAPVYLALGLLLGDRLLIWLVPMVWNATLPGGFDQALKLQGLGGLLAQVAWALRARSRFIELVLGGIAIAGFLVSHFVRPLRILVWLAAVAMVLVDAGIVFVTLKTALAVTTSDIGLGG